MLEIRTHITELLDNIQSEATVMDSATRDGSTYLQAIFSDEAQNIAAPAPDEPNAMSPLLTTLHIFGLPQPLSEGKLSEQEYGSLEPAGVMRSLSKDADPMICQRPDVLLGNTSDFVSYELGTQFFLPQQNTYTEGNALPYSSSRPNPLPVVQGSQDKVKCAWPGCLKFVRKDSHTRHVNETHLRKKKTLCAGCGKGFTRSYMKKYHICPAKM
ncbi:hypothetical protein BD769DRAFT_1667407 [Suillus cothurnatus]|nr:hypothetical protein BD769DRAFT_1667407 [Suillus cothurnatus]